MVTPFDAQGGLDCDGAVKLAQWLQANGSEGLVLACSTGEGTALNDEEKVELWRSVSEAVTIPCLAATGTSDTRHSLELIRLAQKSNVAGALVVTPYYCRPSQAGLLAHFSAVASETDLPVMLYDIPVRSGRRIARSTILELARRHSNLVGVKDSTLDAIGTQRLYSEAPAGFEIYSGDDQMTLPLMAVGAVGVISVAGHWVGSTMSEMVRSFHLGNVARAREINTSLIDAISFQSSEEYPNPLPAKAMCRAMGLPAGQCRLPLGDAPAELDDQAAKLVSALPEFEKAFVPGGTTDPNSGGPAQGAPIG